MRMSGPKPKQQPPSPSPSSRSLKEKQDQLSDWEQTAVRYLIDWLRDDPEQVLALARARIVTGHYVYGDSRMYEYAQGRLLKEVLEELADAVVYTHLYLSRR